MYPLYTKRLVIRPLTEHEAPFILKLLNDPGFLQFIGDKQVRNLEQAREYIRTGPMQSFLEHGFALHLVSLRAENHGEGEPIGICGLLQRDFLPAPDLGFAFLQEFTGQGFGFEATRQVLAEEFTYKGLTKIMAITAPDNEASRALLEKLNFIYTESRNFPQLGGESAIYHLHKAG
ncbi:GNAT family N-acetyltransferase [Thalassotalea mangrovi]|uniref:GNAT family N-acetyltransferase n=1 Tax=Thalassotalea mangrovi TaxID=2572245 RepID=UPI001FEADAF1|nr:GNAT family N-acetyltransferase [Thalassotalea mangrovi]